jgi:UDP-glucuronate 4-epimerase
MPPGCRTTSFEEVDMRILITGGAGFIGYHLAAKLQDENHDITLLDNFNSFYDPEVKRRNVRDLQARAPARLYEVDILDAAGLRRVFEETRPETVVHLAAWAGVRPSLENPSLYAMVNVTGTANLLEAARQGDVSCFIFGSSSSIYGGSERLPFSEDDPADRPISPYAATKRAGELLCYTYSCNYGMNITCLRFFTVYGPRQRPEMAIHKFARLILEGKEIPVFGDGGSRRDYTFVDDIITGIVAAVRANPRFEIINLGESRTTALLELVSQLETVLQRKAALRYLPAQPGDMETTYADIEKARRILGYAPATPIEEGIRRFARWLLHAQ